MNTAHILSAFHWTKSVLFCWPHWACGGLGSQWPHRSAKQGVLSLDHQGNHLTKSFLPPKTHPTSLLTWSSLFFCKTSISLFHSSLGEKHRCLALKLGPSASHPHFSCGPSSSGWGLSALQLLGWPQYLIYHQSTLIYISIRWDQEKAYGTAMKNATTAPWPKLPLFGP